MRLTGYFILIFLFAVFFAACDFVEIAGVDEPVEEPDRDNPTDPGGVVSLPKPTLTIQISGSSTLNTDQVSFTLSATANNPSVDFVYRYKLTTETDFSSWSKQSIYTITQLDEGSNTIEAEVTYEGHETTTNQNLKDSDESTITVNSISGPGLLMVPKRTVSVTRGSTMNLIVRLHDVSGLVGTNARITFPANVFQLINHAFVTPGIIPAGVQKAEFAQPNDSEGWLVMSQTILETQNGVNGSADFATLQLQVRNNAPAGTYTILISQDSDLRNANNQSIIQHRVSKTVVVQ